MTKLAEFIQNGKNLTSFRLGRPVEFGLMHSNVTSVVKCTTVHGYGQLIRNGNPPYIQF